MTISLDFITKDTIERPTRLDLAHLEAAMLAPNHPELRVRLEASASVAYWIENASTLNSQGIALLLDAAFKSDPLTSLADHATSRFVAGVVTGKLLLSVIETRQQPGVVKSLLAEQLAAHGVTVKKINDEIWTCVDPSRPRSLGMRSVSPLWAAFLSVATEYGEHEFPCRAARLPELLGRAKMMGDAGCALKTRQSPTPHLLRPEELYELPASVRFGAAA